MKPGARRLERTGFMGAADRMSFSFLSTRIPYRYSADVPYPATQRQANPYLSLVSIVRRENVWRRDKICRVSQRLCWGRRNEDTSKEVPPGQPPSMYIRDIEEHMCAANQVNVPSKESGLRQNIHPLRTPYAFRKALIISLPAYPQPFKHCAWERAPHSDITNINDIEYKGEQWVRRTSNQNVNLQTLQVGYYWRLVDIGE